MKIFRNAVTHNLSHITADEAGYKIGYINNKSQSIKLEITNNSVQILYTLIIAFVEGSIDRIHTLGHYEGILLSYYNMMINGISALEDDLPDALIPLKDSFVKLGTSVRYRILNPRFIYENDILRIKKYNPGCSEYECDYLITQGEELYLVPDEIMTEAGDFLLLDKGELSSKWKFDKRGE